MLVQLLMHGSTVAGGKVLSSGSNVVGWSVLIFQCKHCTSVAAVRGKATSPALTCQNCTGGTAFAEQSRLLNRATLWPTTGARLPTSYCSHFLPLFGGKYTTIQQLSG
ncbi:uncharacterized protein LOC141599762 [Silene latifolia]|uniref:uncharacterized protein LOC141599762 n=1 Tax=Silene latifolia TaxID=37657 RepID=UPI003D783679